MNRPSVVVIGGGIAGLAAAYELTGGAGGPSATTPRVEILEAAERLGGSLATTSFADRIIDLGADGFLARRPEAVDLVRDLGAEGDLVPLDASGAWIYLRGALHLLPDGLVLGVPTTLAQVRSVRGLSWRARLATARDLYRPRRFTPGDDATIGAITRAKVGDELTTQFIEPMIGGIQAGRVDELSARSVFPALLDAARQGGSLMRALAPTGPANPGPASAARASGPAFYTLRGGTGSLASRLAAVLATRDVIVRTHTPATRVRRVAETYPLRVDTATTTTPASAVIVATPAPLAAALLSDIATLPGLRDVRAAGAAMVTFRVPRHAITFPDRGTGILVPLATPWRDGGSFLVTAVTFLDRKWPHLAHDDDVVFRAHVGRSDDRRWSDFNDEDLAARVQSEVGVLLGTPFTATQTRVQRWPAGLPQYEVGHDELVTSARAAVRDSFIFLAGNAYDGVGIPASIGSGRRAARAALEQLG